MNEFEFQQAYENLLQERMNHIIDSAVTVDEVIEVRKQHPEKYINYFEAVMLEDGKLLAGVGGHTELLEYVAANKSGVTISDFKKQADPQFYYDWMGYTMLVAHAVPIWYTQQSVVFRPNFQQVATLIELQDVGLIEKVNLQVYDFNSSQRVAAMQYVTTEPLLFPGDTKL